jgi:hypothetical protein
MRPSHWSIVVDLLNADAAWPRHGSTKCEIRGTVNERGHIYSALPLMNCHYFHSSSLNNATDESERVLGVLMNVCSKACEFEELP